MELRMCKHCYEGTHGNPEKTAVTRDMVECAERIREYKDLIGIDSLYITRVAEGYLGGEEVLPIVVASIENDRITLTDTQLVMGDDQQNMLVNPEPADILEVLSRNINQVGQQTRQEVNVNFSEESLELVD